MLACAELVVVAREDRSVVTTLRAQSPLALVPRRGVTGASRSDAVVHLVGSASTPLAGDDVTLTLAGSRHIAGVINAPAARKYQHWTNDALPPTLSEWQAGAIEHPGSWWEHWAAWLHQRSGPQIPSRDPLKGRLKPIEPAPGAYVKVKS